MRFTKIICTIGPSSDSDEILSELVTAGMDVARLNMSFGDHSYHRKMIRKIRDISETSNKHVAILMDLSGTKTRIGRLRSPVTLHRGETVTLSSENHEDGRTIPVTDPEILKHLRKGETVYLADGTIKLRVISEGLSEVKAEVIEGGHLTSYKGISFSELSKDVSVTDKDIRDIEFGIREGVDWIAQSFVRRANDIQILREIITEKGSDTPIIAKIEKREAVKNLERIIRVSDAVMVARGDLGIEMPVEEIPVIQKRIIRLANQLGKPAITATQMLKSMVVQNSPTRAEVTDVANAVLDGSDALMLSEETASGKHPVEAVKVMDRVIRKAESIYKFLQDHPAKNTSSSIAGSAAKISSETEADAIITFTRTGTSAVQISRYRPPVRIIVAAHSEQVLRRMSVVWGCVPLVALPLSSSPEKLLTCVVEECLKRGYLHRDSTAVITSGFPFGEPGTTNTIRVLNVKDIITSE